MTNNLKKVGELGQQIWLDNLSRSLIQSGMLAERIKQGISGVTSNPSIFYQSIKNDPLYADDVTHLKTQNLSKQERYEQLAISDVQNACDAFLPLYKESQADRGYVSLEVSPELAYNTKDTIIEAHRLWKTINRPNLMIKVPATPDALIAIVELISLGINVNVTLIFSQEMALKTFEAYTAGLRLRNKSDKNINNIRLVSSMFMSRIDAVLDPQLPEHLQGKAAISIAKSTYLNWQQFCEQPFFKTLEELGALRPSLLWASTGTKNPNYPDTLYVDNLIGSGTVNTLPEKTLDAFLDHGQPKDTLTSKITDSLDMLTQIDQIVSLDKVANSLQADGLKQFEEAFDQLLDLLK